MTSDRPGRAGSSDPDAPAGLERLGHFCARRHWPVIIAWLLLVLSVGVISQAEHGTPDDKFVIPGTQSQKAADLLESQFPSVGALNTTVALDP